MRISDWSSDVCSSDLDPEPWEAAAVNEEQARNNPWLITPAQRPQVVLSFADAEHLLVSGLLDGGGEMAGRAAVVNARYGSGNVLMFAINPTWCVGTDGRYPPVISDKRRGGEEWVSKCRSGAWRNQYKKKK